MLDDGNMNERRKPVLRTPAERAWQRVTRLARRWRVLHVATGSRLRSYRPSAVWSTQDRKFLLRLWRLRQICCQQRKATMRVLRLLLARL